MQTLLGASSLAVLLLLAFSGFVQANNLYFPCPVGTRCYYKPIMCPRQCPTTTPSPDNPNKKVCSFDCNSPKCEAKCKNPKANCNSPGSACHDPRFIGGDGVVFYFHGKSNEHFGLVSDVDFQINGRFIGHRPAGRPRDFTWIQALGVLFNSHTFTLEATKAETWDNEVDHLKFTYNGIELVIPEGFGSVWYSPEEDVKVERVTSKNSVTVTFKDRAEISVNVVPITKEDDRVHNYQVPANDCFAHLEVQFRFFYLSPKVEGVLGRTYRLDFENPAKPGVAMPVLGGEAKYRTTSLLSGNCLSCIYSPDGEKEEVTSSVVDYGTLDCTPGASVGYGIVCRK